MFPLKTTLIILLIFVCFIQTETIYRLRKHVRRNIQQSTHRRSATDDALDLEAAELIFKENGKIKGGDGKKLPFGTEHTKDSAHHIHDSSTDAFPTAPPSSNHEDVGAPSTEPSLRELERMHLKEEADEDMKLLEKQRMKEVGKNGGESSMIAPAPVEDKKGEDGEDGEEGMEGTTTMTSTQNTLKTTETTTTTFTEEMNNNDEETTTRQTGPQWKILTPHGRRLPYDFHINPEYPQFAPRARGLVGIPDGWNLDKQVDEEFRSGFRFGDFRQ